VLTDGLCILNVYFWSWPPQVAAVVEAITPGLFGARNVFWVGMISYISDNSPNESRTLKYGIINAIYTISTLFGTGLAGLLNVNLGFYGAFSTSILLNLISLFVGFFFVQDTSEPYDDRVVWLKPKCFFRSYSKVFQNKTKVYAVTLIVLLLAQAILVGRIGGKLIVPNTIPTFTAQSINVVRLTPFIQ